MAKPLVRATTLPTWVAESGSRFLSTDWPSRLAMGSDGPATPYPEYSMTVGHGTDALQVLL